MPVVQASVDKIHEDGENGTPMQQKQCDCHASSKTGNSIKQYHFPITISFSVPTEFINTKSYLLYWSPGQYFDAKLFPCLESEHLAQF